MRDEGPSGGLTEGETGKADSGKRWRWGVGEEAGRWTEQVLQVLPMGKRLLLRFGAGS